MRNLVFLFLVFLLSGCVDEVAYSIESYIKESPEVKSNNFVFKQADESNGLYSVVLTLGAGEEESFESIYGLIKVAAETKGLDEYYKLRDKLESSYEERVLELCPGSSHKDEKAVWNSVSSSSFTIVLTTAKQGRFVDVRCKRPEG